MRSLTSEEAALTVCTGLHGTDIASNAYAECVPADLVSSFYADPDDGLDEIALPLHFTDFMLRQGDPAQPCSASLHPAPLSSLLRLVRPDAAV